jgi:hypothetical protein
MDQKRKMYVLLNYLDLILNESIWISNLKTLLEILTKSDEQATANTTNSNESLTSSNDATLLQSQQQQQTVNMRNFDELNEKYEFLLNRIDNMEQNLINNSKTTIVNNDTITITKTEYQSLLSRITLLENELVLIKVRTNLHHAWSQILQVSKITKYPD